MKVTWYVATSASAARTNPASKSCYPWSTSYRRHIKSQCLSACGSARCAETTEQILTGLRLYKYASGSGCEYSMFSLYPDTLPLIRLTHPCSDVDSSFSSDCTTKIDGENIFLLVLSACLVLAKWYNCNGMKVTYILHTRKHHHLVSSAVCVSVPRPSYSNANYTRRCL